MAALTTPVVGANPTLVVAGTGTNSDQGNEFALGTIIVGDDGDEFIYCHASEAISANNAVVFHETFEVENIDTTISASTFGMGCGVAETALSDNDFGWIKISGETSLNVATSCAVHTQLNSTASAGRLDDDASSGAEIINDIVTTGAESGNVATAFLRRPSIGATLT